ncbi:MAG: hypothetical protein AABY93_19185, partial [Bacteroidota bacterium]
MKRILLAVLFFFPFLTGAQNLTVDWVNAIGGATGDEIIQSTVVDDSGNVYISGSFEGTVNFNPNSSPTSLTSAGLSDAFFAKYTNDGVLVWVRQLGSTAEDEVYVMTVDGSNVYIAGYFNGTVDFDPGSNVGNLTSVGVNDIFFGKYSSVLGSLVWADALGSTGFDAAIAIKVDPSGNVYVAGFYDGTVDFDPDNSVVNSKTSVGDFDVFLGKYSSAGDLVWIDTFGSIGQDIGISIDIDNSNVYISGYYSDTIDLDPGASVSNTTNQGGRDGFFAKYTLSTGTLAWWATIRSSGDDQITSILTSGTDIYLGGVFSGSANFFSNSGNISKTSNGGTDIFIAKYDGGTVLPTSTWINTIGGSLDDRTNLMALDASGNVYSTGYFQGTADFDPSSSITDLVSSGGQDIYIASYGSASGSLIIAEKIGGSIDDEGTTIALDASDNVYVGGYFQNTASFDLTFSSQDKTSQGFWDGYIAKYSQSSSLAPEPTAQSPGPITFFNITFDSFDGNFPVPNPAPDGYLVLMSANVPPDFVPVDGDAYAYNQIVGTTATGGNDIYVVQNTNSPSFSIVNVVPPVTIFFKVYSYNGSGTSINYRQVIPLEGNVSLGTPEPTSQPTNLLISNPTSTS